MSTLGTRGRWALGTGVVAVLVTFLSLPAVGTVGASAGPERGLTIVEYNILGADHPLGQRIGGPLRGRTRRAAGFLARGDIASTQEDTARQQLLLSHFLPAYSSFPAQPDDSITNVIYFRTDEFELVGSGYFTYPSESDPSLSLRRATGHGTWVRLHDVRSGAVYLVVDAHLPSRSDIRGTDRGGAQKRRVAARVIARLVVRDKSEHLDDVAVVGADTNTKKWLTNHQSARTPHSNDTALRGNRKDLPDCILTYHPSLLRNAFDLARDRHGSCPTATKDAQTDEVLWVYLTPEPGARYDEQRLFGRREQATSDHPPVLVRIERR